MLSNLLSKGKTRQSAHLAKTHLRFGELPVIIKVHLLERLVRSWSIPYLYELYIKDQGALWWDKT